MKSCLRFQLVSMLCAGIVVLAGTSLLNGQETIRPQFMFGGNLGGLGPQDTAIEGEVLPFRETTEIRPLPPPPPQSAAFGFPAPTIAQPVNQGYSPSVPDLGYPGEQLPMMETHDQRAFAPTPVGLGPVPSQFVPSGNPVTPNHQFTPYSSGQEFVAPSAYNRRPVVIPNEPVVTADQATSPEFREAPSVGQGSYDFNQAFGQPLLENPMDSTVINEGFRRTTPTVRGGPLDDYGQEFDFENKKQEYPPFSEIMKTGRYFGNAEFLYVKPYFQNNTAITVEGANTGFSETFDFGYDTANRFLLGFESKYGPGAELNYFQYDHQSRVSDFTSSGGFQGESATWMAGPGRWTRLRTANDGDRLTAVHSLEVQNLGITFFKDWKLPIAKLGGGFGIQYMSIEQDLQSRLFDAAGTQIGSLSARHELRAFGPKFEFKYYRPVGHTKLDIIGGFSGAVMFGNRDQSVLNTATLDTSRIGADEFLMVFDVIAGLQYSHQYADNRNFYARLSLMSQAWLGGGTAMLPQDNFGFRGVGFAVGFNR